jgi:hypothetical protein
MPVVAMTREMGSLGSVMRDAAREYWVRESRLVGVVEEAPGLLERLRRPGFRYRAYLEAAVLEAALQDRVVLVGGGRLFGVDWTDPLLYDLVINTGDVGVTASVGQVFRLVAAPEFQSTMASRPLLAVRALAAGVRAILQAPPETARVDLDVQAAGGHV